MPRSGRMPAIAGHTCRSRWRESAKSSDSLLAKGSPNAQAVAEKIEGQHTMTTNTPGSSSQGEVTSVLMFWPIAAARPS